jgi:hypothetical protein
MKSFRRLGAGVAVTGLLTLGAVGASTAVASAGTVGTCSASGTLATCAVSGAPVNPLTITAAVTTSPGQSADISWSTVCEQGGVQQKTSGSYTAKAPFTHTIPHAYHLPDECSIVVIAGLDSGSGGIHLSVSSASTAPVHEIKGYGGKCVDDKGNSSALRAEIQLWTCNSSDQAQSFAFTNGELVHNGKCLNDQASGGNGSKVILYTCNRAPNETWTHNSRGEYVLKANGGRLCLDDPGYSKQNGTQLTVYTCNNGSNQHWSLP